MSSEEKVIYVCGGCRSGKSAYAQQRVEDLGSKRVYIATCPQIDGEMDERIAKHQQEREGRCWRTIEAPFDLEEALDSIDDDEVVLVDCLTLWINNLLYQAQQQGTSVSEEDVRQRCQQLIDRCRHGHKTVVFVTNELGMGLVPADSVSRRYRDLVGRCNQTIAAQADEAFFVVSGYPVRLNASAGSGL